MQWLGTVILWDIDIDFMLNKADLKALEQLACFAVAVILHEMIWTVFCIFTRFDIRPVLNI